MAKNKTPWYNTSNRTNTTWLMGFTIKNGETHCYACGIDLHENRPIPEYSTWVWRGHCFCSQKCARTLVWPDPKRTKERKRLLRRLKVIRERNKDVPHPNHIITVPGYQLALFDSDFLDET